MGEPISEIGFEVIVRYGVEKSMVSLENGHVTYIT